MYPGISRQEKIDRIMCKPGYTWNETLQRCIGAYGGGGGDTSDPAPKPEPAPEPADDAIKKESGKRAAKNGKMTKGMPTA
tara:strand:- start:281 stop:520 length:240 start_codon:yes stop_codon:yes gene_type:complete